MVWVPDLLSVSKTLCKSTDTAFLEENHHDFLVILSIAKEGQGIRSAGGKTASAPIGKVLNLFDLEKMASFALGC